MVEISVFKYYLMTLMSKGKEFSLCSKKLTESPHQVAFWCKNMSQSVAVLFQIPLHPSQLHGARESNMLIGNMSLYPQ